MNIAKHKEIMALQGELEALENEFQEKQTVVVDANIDRLLSAAVKEFIAYVQSEGFSVNGDESKSLRAVLDDDIEIQLERKPKAISVYMPNGERYSVRAETTLEVSKPYSQPGKLSQDAEIENLKKDALKIKESFDLIDTQEFRYILSTEEYSSIYGIQYGKRYFVNFKDILSIMFS